MSQHPPSDRPKWIGAAVYVGMGMTFVGVIAAQFLPEGTTQMILVWGAVLGIALSMAPFWAPNLRQRHDVLGRLVAKLDQHFD